jgi:hypothetical protein
MEPMPPEGVESTVKRTVKKMTEQTGKEPGKSTGLCHLVVTGALTGADIDFTVDVTRENQILLESATGLANYPVEVRRNVSMFDAVTTLLEQEQVPIKALLLTGKVNNPDPKVDETHVIAVVQDREGKYGIIDSLVEGAVEKVDDFEAVASHVDGRFDTTTRSLRYSVVLTEVERAKRLAVKGRRMGAEPVEVGPGVFI